MNTTVTQTLTELKNDFDVMAAKEDAFSDIIEYVTLTMEVLANKTGIDYDTVYENWVTVGGEAKEMDLWVLRSTR